MPLRATAIDREAADPRRRAMFVALGLVAWMARLACDCAAAITRHNELSTRAKNQQLCKLKPVHSRPASRSTRSRISAQR